jgi:hypothetical protein
LHCQKSIVRLCRRCSNIRLRLEQILSVEDHVIFLGTLQAIKERHGCAICTLVLQSLPVLDRDANDDTPCFLNPRYGAGTSFALVYGGERPPVIKVWIQIDCPPGILKDFSSSPLGLHALEGSQLANKIEESLTLNTSAIRSWLQECETQHGQDCHSQGIASRLARPVSVKDWLLIDVVDHRLVKGDTTLRYLALSYVWGEWGGFDIFTGSWAASDLLHTKGALLKLRLPTVLRGAMELTLALGERYLWCDAICVYQESVAQKQVHLVLQDFSVSC